MRVAVVDDDEGVRRALGRLLRAGGHQAYTCASAEEFLAHSPADEFDCLVLDVQLGGLSGFELRDRLRERGQAPPTVFLTAHENVEFPARARELGSELLAKPVSAATLFAAIEHAAPRKT